MWTIISILFALGINFSIPPILDSKRSIKTDSYLQIGFPFNYYEGENLTDEELNYRIKVIYVTYFTYLTINYFYFGPSYSAGYSTLSRSVYRKIGY